MKKYLVKTKVKSLLNSIEGPIQLNIGCGTDYKKGWINIDNNSDHNIEQLDLNWDLRNPLPFADNSVDFIFNEHLVEHLTPDEARIVLRDLKRVLKPEGVLRIAMPNLEEVVDQYIHLPLSKDPTIKRFKLDYIKTKAERINIAFRDWGHRWLYDAEELKRRLKETGFENIEQCNLRESKYPNLRNLEIREESNLIMEAKK